MSDKQRLKQLFIDELQKLILSHGFKVLDMSSKGDSFVYFILELPKGNCVFACLLSSKYSLRLSCTCRISYLEVDRLVHDIGIKMPFEEGWACVHAILASYLNEVRPLADKSGWGSFGAKLMNIIKEMPSKPYLPDNSKTYDPLFDFTEQGMGQAVTFVYECFFKQAVLPIIEETDTIQKTDALINDYIARSGFANDLRKRPHFMYTPIQSITGTILSCMLLRNDRQKLVEYHVREYHDMAPRYQEALQILIRHYVDSDVLSKSLALEKILNSG
jgi:hypothetical protein